MARKVLSPASRMSAQITDNDYVASYSRNVRFGGITLALVCVAFAWFICLRSVRLDAGTIMALTCAAGSVWYAAYVSWASIRFTGEGVIARVGWFRSVSARYSEIESIRGRFRSVVLYFKNGRSLHLHPGLGDPEIIFAYLQAHCADSVLDAETTD